MSRITIANKIINGDTAVSIEIRIIMYHMDNAALDIFYAYFNAGGKRIGDGNLSIANPISNSTKASLLSSVTNIYPSALNIILAANQLYDNLYEFIYTQSGIPHLDVVVGSVILGSEYDAIKSAVFTLLGIGSGSSSGGSSGIGSMAIGSTFIIG